GVSNAAVGQLLVEVDELRAGPRHAIDEAIRSQRPGAIAAGAEAERQVDRNRDFVNGDVVDRQNVEEAHCRYVDEGGVVGWSAEHAQSTAFSKLDILDGIARLRHATELQQPIREIEWRSSTQRTCKEVVW